MWREADAAVMRGFVMSAPEATTTRLGRILYGFRVVVLDHLGFGR